MIKDIKLALVFDVHKIAINKLASMRCLFRADMKTQVVKNVKRDTFKLLITKYTVGFRYLSQPIMRLLVSSKS